MEIRDTITEKTPAVNKRQTAVVEEDTAIARVEKQMAVAEREKERTPGGDDPHRFDVREAWYPVYYLKDLDKTKLSRFTLLGTDLVIWWDTSEQSWRAFEDKCPHRLAPLSQGRINEAGLLECPYHGWTFSGTGQCDRIPQQVEGANAAASKRACVASLPTIECQGLLFVYPGEPENAAHTRVPLVDPLLESPDEWICLNTFRDLPYDALTLLENTLDSSHIPYTHHGTVGNRVYAGPVELEVVSASKQGFQGVWEEGPRRGNLGRQHTTFVAPSLMWHDLTSQQFGRTLTVVYATPTRKGECRLFARFPFKFASKTPGLFMKLMPEWMSHLRQNSILEDDQIFLHYQERYLEAAGGSANVAKVFYLPTKADRFVSELRKWVNEYGAEPFPGESLPPAASQEQLLDRYHSHTVKCSSCRGAIATIERLRQGTAIAAAIAWSITPLLAVSLGDSAFLAVAVSTLFSLSCGGAWLGLGKLKRNFYQGEDVPARNLTQKKPK